MPFPHFFEREKIPLLKVILSVVINCSEFVSLPAVSQLYHWVVKENKSEDH